MPNPRNGQANSNNLLAFGDEFVDHFLGLALKGLKQIPPYNLYKIFKPKRVIKIHMNCNVYLSPVEERVYLKQNDEAVNLKLYIKPHQTNSPTPMFFKACIVTQ